MENIVLLQLKELYNFNNHPFKVEKNKEFYELARSIENEGIIVPLLARPDPHRKGYELISGHRRKLACELMGINEVPVIVKDLDDNEAIIAMVDSNLQRENIKLSEKAYAYQMKLNAIKKQGKRSDLTSGQDDLRLNEIETIHIEKSNDGTTINRKKGNLSEQNKINSRQLLARQVGESERQIQRYIRLTYLIPQILDMVDEGQIAFTIAVELSYLKEEEQYELHAVMDLNQCTPSLSQANRLRRMSQKNELNMDAIYNILDEQKPNQKEYVKLSAEFVARYTPQFYTDRQKIELLQTLLKEWYEGQNM